MIEATKKFIESGNYRLLKEEKCVIFFKAITLNLIYQEIIDLSIFEKYIIKLIDKASQNNISFLDKQIIDTEKIAKILVLDNELIQKNIDILIINNLISKQENTLVINWDENLKNWKKKIFKEKQEILYFTDEDFEKFSKIDTDAQSLIIQNKLGENQTLKEFSLAQEDEKDEGFNHIVLFDKKNLELKIVYEKDNLFSEEIPLTIEIDLTILR